MITETALTPGLAEKLRVKVRSDLVIREQLYEGRTHYVVKDPVGLKYFRFKEEEYFLLKSLDGKRRLDEVREDYEREFPPQKITIEELARFTSQLTTAGLAGVDTPRQGQVLYERFKKQRFKQRLAAWTNVLYIKIPVFDPDKLLTWMLPYFRWIYYTPVVYATILFWIVAAMWTAAHYDEVQARLPEFHTFFNWRNLFFMWISLGVVKVIHEFGHGLTCKYFGGECHEMGALFLVLSPCLYCDVSDSWLLPNKWQRVWIGAAGIYVELTIASLCVFIWWNADAGLVQNLALQTMFLCSVNTVMFNGNPLLRYDGYYMLMDMMEIPNLRAKAARFFSNIFGKFCLGLPTDMEPYLPKTRRSFFFLFAIASYVYRWVISFSILWFMYRFLVPYKLSTLSTLLAIGSLGTLLVVPSYQMGRYLWEYRRTTNVSKLRLSITAAVFLILAGLFFYLPLPMHVTASFITTLERPEFLWVVIPGELADQSVVDGDHVESGQSLATLVNLQKQEDLLNLERQAEQHRILAEAYRSSESRRSEVEREEVLAREYAGQAAKLREDLGQLQMVAHRSGTVTQPPKPEMRGTYLQSGQRFCQIGDLSKLEALLVIDQSDKDDVQDGQKAKLNFNSHALDTFTGSLRMANVDVERMPEELSNFYGGDVATKQDPKTHEHKPVHTLYYAVVSLPNPDGILAPGMRGRAKIEAQPTPLGMRVWRWIKRLFQFET